MAKKRKQRRKKSYLQRLTMKAGRMYKRIMQTMVFVLFVIAGIYCCRALLGSCSEKKERETVSSKEYNGIDVSKHNGKINWQKVAADERIQFVYIKATEGATRKDACYQRNISKAREQGIKVGSYHYFISWRTAQEQFDNFRRNVDPSQQDLIPMVDVEEMGCRTATRASLQGNLEEFMQLVKEEYGVYPLLYSQYSFYNSHLAPEFNKYYIFIARYSRNKPHLKGTGKYNIWQFTERGRIAGISTPVDLDRFENGTTIDDIMLH